MSKVMLLNIQPDEERVAIVENGVLNNLEIETSATTTLKGNIYKGIIRKVEPSLQACFVDYGTSKNGFLPRGEIHPNQIPEGRGRHALIQEIFKEGQEVMVQVVRDAIGNKGVTFSTFTTLAGRFLVLVPDNDRVAVSKKLTVDERKRFKSIAAEMTVPDGYGVIIRTAADGKTREQIFADLNYLKNLHNSIQNRFESKRGVGLIYREADLGLRFIRDYLTPDISTVYVDDVEAYERIREFMNHVMVDSLKKLQLYRRTVPLFVEHKVEERVEETFARTVPLPGGGAIVIDQTEALVAIDVNSGSTKTSHVEDTAFQTNLKACKTIAQQMILRDTGGLIVIDFIDMRDPARRREVEKALRHAMSKDKAARRIGRISQFGLLEMTRQRLRSTALQQTFQECGSCHGRGMIRSTPSAAMKVLRKIQEAAATKRANVVRVHLPVETGNFLLNRRRRFLASLEDQYRCHLDIRANPNLSLNEVTLEYISLAREELPRDNEIISETLQLLEEPDVQEIRDLQNEEAVKSSGFNFVSWLKSLFGGGSSAASSPAAREQAVEDETEDLGKAEKDTSPAKRTRSSQDRSRGRGRGQRNSNSRDRSRRRRPNDGPIIGGVVSTMDTAPEKSSQDERPGFDSDETKEEGGEQRRRRRRRRRRRPRSDEEKAATQNSEERTDATEEKERRPSRSRSRSRSSASSRSASSEQASKTQESASETQTPAEKIVKAPSAPVDTAPTSSAAEETSTTAAKSTTAKSTTAKSTTAKSTTAKSTTAKSTTAKSTAAKSTAAKSTAAKSTTAKSTAAKSTTAKSTTAKSTTAKSTTAKSTAAKSTAAKSTTAESGAAPKTEDSPKEVKTTKTTVRRSAREKKPEVSSTATAPSPPGPSASIPNLPTPPKAEDGPAKKKWAPVIDLRRPND